MLKKIINPGYGSNNRESEKREENDYKVDKVEVAKPTAPSASSYASSNVVATPAPSASSYNSSQFYSSNSQSRQEEKSNLSSIMNSSKNILSNDVEIKGSIKFTNDLVIDGKIEGEVHSGGSLTVGENALIVGEVKTRSVTVFGKVNGNIAVTERCELKSNASLEGDIHAGTLSIEEGATFLGNSKVGTSASTSSSSSRSSIDSSSISSTRKAMPSSPSIKASTQTSQASSSK